MPRRALDRFVRDGDPHVLAGKIRQVNLQMFPLALLRRRHERVLQYRQSRDANPQYGPGGRISTHVEYESWLAVGRNLCPPCQASRPSVRPGNQYSTSPLVLGMQSGFGTSLPVMRLA